MARRTRTVSMIRMLRALGPLKPRRGRMPRQQHPDLVAKEYLSALMPFVRVATHEVAKVREQIVGMLRQERAEDERREAAAEATRSDAGPRSKEAQALIDRAARQAAAAFEPRQITAVAKKFGTRTSEHQKRQLDAEVRAAVGVPLAMLEAPIVAKLEGFAALNVDLIKTVSERYFDRLRLDVTEAFESGMHPETLAELFVERDGMAENDARRIARDQIGKLNGQLNEERQKGMGVSGYTWRTANDNRVRDEHTEREGQHYEWSDPPEDGHPGEAIQCRCFAEPDLGPILEGL